MENLKNEEFPPIFYSYELNVLKILGIRKFSQIVEFEYNENEKTFLYFSKPCNNQL
jgi:hypothetical protein